MPKFQGLAHYGLAGIAFQWLLLTEAMYRVTRFITTDSFPPMAHLRTRIERVFGGSDWADLITCNWCVGLYVCSLAYALVAQMFPVPLPVIQAAASMTLIGYLGNWDE